MKKLMLALVAVAAPMLLAGGCKCGTTRTTNPKLEVLDAMGGERKNVDFGFVQVMIKGTQEVRIRNSGNAVLTISEAKASRAEFGIDTPLPLDVPTGGEAMLKLTFTPTVADQRITGTMTLTSNDPSLMTYELSLAGQGVTAVARTDVRSIDFGDVYVRETKMKSVTLTNTGGNALPVMGASITNSSPDVTGDFTALNGAMIASGASVTVTLQFTPMTAGAIGGQLVIAIDPAYGGNITVPITGRGTEALPRMCFKFDDQAMERCTDQITTSLNLPFGALCDNVIYATGPTACTAQNGQRSGVLYFRNEGNVPLQFSVRYRPYVEIDPRCPDAGAPHSDFVFANVAVPDGGVPSDFNMPTLTLPVNEMVAKPWETMPIRITYRATSRCPAETSEQAQILWTRQGDTRTPGTLFATLSGTSLLPSAKPKTVNLGQQGTPANVPLTVPISVELIVNQGVAPLSVTAITMMEELPAYLPDGGTYDAGGPEGGILQACNPSSPVYDDSDCSRFQWTSGPNLPATLDGGGGMVSLGRMQLGCHADGGDCPISTTRYKVIARVSTTDPYAPIVDVPIIAWVRYIP